jgi:hypothetical protein
MELQVIGDRAVKKLAFSHIVHSIRRMNQKHKDEAKNRKLQNVLFKIVQVCNISQMICQLFSGLTIRLVSVHLTVPFPTSSNYVLFLRVRKSREQRGLLLSYVIFTVEGSGLMTAQLMLYAMLVSILRRGTCCQKK